MKAYWYADTAPSPEPRARVSTASSATWLDAAKPTVQPDSRMTRRTAGCRGLKLQRSSIPARRIDGMSAAAMDATPAVVPSPRR